MYDEDMSTEDREGTAFSCTFEEPAGHSSEVEGSQFMCFAIMTFTAIFLLNTKK